MLIPILVFSFSLVSATDYCKLCKNGIHTMCKFKEGPAPNCINYTHISLKPGDIRYILDIHNDVRNHVASGKESRGALGNQPAAADMFLLDWDDELAEIAQRWADQCVSINVSEQHDECRRTEHFDVGQNVVTAITNDLELPELSLLILNWYQQIVYIIPSDVDDFSGVWRGKNPIGQYTQLIWAKTRLVGCAAAAFKETVTDSQYNVRFVCNYGPAGNIIGEPIYQRGEPCSKCPHKMCDRLRPNLCADIKKSINVKKQKEMVFKKYRDKATILSNDIDIDDATQNISEFLDANTLDISKESINTISTSKFNIVAVKHLRNLNQSTNVPPINRTMFNNGITREITFTIPLSSLMKNNDNATYSSTFRGFTTKYILQNTRYSNDAHTSTTVKNINPDSNPSVLENGRINRLFLNKSFLNTFRKRNHTNNSTFRFVSSLKQVLDEFFNQTVSDDLKEIRKPTTRCQPVINMMKNKCQKEMKLGNGVILVQDCKGDWRLPDVPRRKVHFRRKMKPIVINGSEIILPGNRRFKRAMGIWHKGHCNCVQYLRSSSTNLNITNTMFLIFFVHFLKI